MAKILIVEDEAIIAQFFAMELEIRNYKVCAKVATARDAIENAQIHDPDLILMDINLLGEMDGIEAAEIILEKKYVPIVFMTGYSQKEYTDRAKNIDCKGYLRKPVEVEEIEEIIKKLEL